MKYFLFIFICICVFLTIPFSALVLHGSRVVNEVGENMYIHYKNDCPLGTVELHKDFLGVYVEANNCDGPNSGGHGYRATLFARSFWLDR